MPTFALLLCAASMSPAMAGVQSPPAGVVQSRSPDLRSTPASTPRPLQMTTVRGPDFQATGEELPPPALGCVQSGLPVAASNAASLPAFMTNTPSTTSGDAAGPLEGSGADQTSLPSAASTAWQCVLPSA